MQNSAPGVRHVLPLHHQTIMSITMKYHRFLLPCLLVLLLTSCAAPYAKRCVEGLDRSSLRVTISKGACFGQCPIYTGVVFGDGTVEYYGERFVEREGAHSGKISPEDLCAIVTEIERRKLMIVDTAYVEEVPDAPMTKITIAMRGRSTAVIWNMTTPELFRRLQTLLVKATHENPALVKSE